MKNFVLFYMHFQQPCCKIKTDLFPKSNKQKTTKKHESTFMCIKVCANARIIQNVKYVHGDAERGGATCKPGILYSV